MSDETKGATVMVPGCRHDNIADAEGRQQDGLHAAVCPDCAAIIDLATWRKLHPPPEPQKSWVRQKAEGDGGRLYSETIMEHRERLLRETVEECCRVLAAKYHPNLFDDLRRAMLEPKA